MVPRERLINKLRELKYTYADQTDKSVLWRKKGGTHYVWFRRKEDPMSVTYVSNILRQCGVAERDIEVFVAQNRCH